MSSIKNMEEFVVSLSENQMEKNDRSGKKVVGGGVDDKCSPWKSVVHVFCWFAKSESPLVFSGLPARSSA